MSWWRRWTRRRRVEAAAPLPAAYRVWDEPPLRIESHPLTVAAVETLAAVIAPPRLVLGPPDPWRTRALELDLPAVVLEVVRDAVAGGDGWALLVGAGPELTVRYVARERVSPQWDGTSDQLLGATIDGAWVPGDMLAQLRFSTRERRGRGVFESARHLLWCYDQVAIGAAVCGATVARLPVVLETDGAPAPISRDYVAALPSGASVLVVPQGWHARRLESPDLVALMGAYRVALASAVGLAPALLEPTASGSYSAGKLSYAAFDALCAARQAAVIRDVLRPVARAMGLTVAFSPVGAPPMEEPQEEVVDGGGGAGT